MPAATTEAQAGDVILFRGTSVVARLIRLFDGTDWNHCGHLIDTDLLAEIDAGVPVGTKKLSEKLASYGKRGESYAGVFRLKRAIDGTITSMQPLAESTGAIIARAPSYGYDAIILLFLLSISKKVPSIPWWGRALITLVGRRAAGLLLDLEQNGKAPLICSAFTHHAYGSVATDQDKFSIGVPGFRLAALREARKRRPRAMLAPEPGSILAEHMKSRAALSTQSTPGLRRSQLVPTDIPEMAAIEKAGADFLKKARGQTPGREPVRTPRAAAVLANNPDLASAIETALQFFPAVGPGARGAALIGGEDRLVSPGDLSASASLKQVGRLDADGTFTSV